MKPPGILKRLIDSLPVMGKPLTMSVSNGRMKKRARRSRSKNKK
jgi:hypothetical protein